MSQLKSFATCSEQYRLERIARIKTPPAAWTIRGTALHTAYEDWETAGRRDDIAARYVRAYDEGIAKARQEWPDIKQWPRPMSWKPETAIDKYREIGAETARALAAEALRGEWTIAELPDGRLAIEVPFVLEIGGTTVIGYVDSVLEWSNGVLTVRDLKSGKKNPTPIQLGVYALALREALGWDIWQGDYWTGENNASTGMVDLRRYTREFVDRLVRALEEGVSRQVFLPAPGDLCKMCGVRDFCREQGSRWEEALAFERVPSV